MLRYKTKTRPGLVAVYDIRPGDGAGTLEPARGHRVSKTEPMIFCTTLHLPIIVYGKNSYSIAC